LKETVHVRFAQEVELLRNRDRSDGIMEMMIAGVKSALMRQPFRVPHDLRNLVAAQEAIGWIHLFKGWIWCSVDERKSLLSKDGHWPHQERGRGSASTPHFLATCLSQRQFSFIQEKQA